ncbi:MAG TPA: cell division protein ZapA [Bacteroidales bacterium]
MEGTSQYIKVIIAGRPYMMSVERDEEEIVRKAANHINEMVLTYSKSFEYKDQQDLFAMITLQHVANSIRLESNITYKDNEMEKNLSRIDGLLKNHLAEN